MPQHWATYHQQWVQSILSSSTDSPGHVRVTKAKYTANWNIDYANFLGISVGEFTAEIQPLLHQRTYWKNEIMMKPFSQQYIRRLQQNITNLEETIRAITGKKEIDSPHKINKTKKRRANEAIKENLTQKGMQLLRELKAKRRQAKNLSRHSKTAAKCLEWSGKVDHINQVEIPQLRREHALL